MRAVPFKPVESMVFTNHDDLVRFLTEYTKI